VAAVHVGDEEVGTKLGLEEEFVSESSKDERM